MTSRLWTWTVAVGLAACVTRVRTQENMAKADDAMSPPVQAAIAELSSDSFKAREKAVGDLRMAMGEQLRALIAAPGSVSQARVRAALEFNSGLTRWALEIMKLPDEQRKQAAKFGLQPDVVPVVAAAFSPNVTRRIDGIRTLTRLDDPHVTMLIGCLIEDVDRQVRVAAIEAAGDRKPTNEVVDLLWNCTIGPNVNWANQTYVMINMQQAPESMSMRPVNLQDTDTACTALIKLKSPRVGERLKESMETIEMMYTKCPPGTAPLMFNSATGPMKSFFRLMKEYKPKGAMGPLYRVATGTLGQAIAPNGHYWSSRTPYIGEFVELIGEKAEDYKLQKSPMAGGGWTFPTDHDETEAIGKLRDWWAKHGQEYDAAPPIPGDQ